MNYADLELGTWYPQKGMGEIPKAMEKVAKKLGVTFHYNNNVTQIESLNGKAKRLITSSGNFEIDAVIAGADYHHVETKMLVPQDRSYSNEYWENRTMSPSSLLYYLGLNKRVKNLLHHNLFFDEPFGLHAEEIYDHPQWPTQPLFYACVPSLTDNTLAPPNCENMFLLVPVAPGLTSDESLRDKYLQNMLDRLEKRTGESIREHIVYKKSFAHEEFISEYNSFKGNAYGLANTLKQTAILKPSMRSKKLSNLFYAGQLTVPGPGMPPSIISGQLAAETMNKLLFQS
jgi:phytoene desaturase